MKKRIMGSKYDVAARGKQIKALDAADELLNKLLVINIFLNLKTKL